MARVIVLDSSVLGLATNPTGRPEAVACANGVVALAQGNDSLVIPEVADYELRRELLLHNKRRGLSRLEALKAISIYVPITTQAMLLAAGLWAQVRQQGRKTADNKALDIDVILAAQARLLTNLGDEITIATTNVRHLSLFVDAREWQAIPAS